MFSISLRESELLMFLVFEWSVLGWLLCVSLNALKTCLFICVTSFMHVCLTGFTTRSDIGPAREANDVSDDRHAPPKKKRWAISNS